MENDRDHDLPPAASNRNGFYSLQGNHSSVSVFEDVEMAHDEVSGTVHNLSLRQWY